MRCGAMRCGRGDEAKKWNSNTSAAVSSSGWEKVCIHKRGSETRGERGMAAHGSGKEEAGSLARVRSGGGSNARAKQHKAHAGWRTLVALLPLYHGHHAWHRVHLRHVHNDPPARSDERTSQQAHDDGDGARRIERERRDEARRSGNNEDDSVRAVDGDRVEVRVRESVFRYSSLDIATVKAGFSVS